LKEGTGTQHPDPEAVVDPVEPRKSIAITAFSPHAHTHTAVAMSTTKEAVVEKLPSPAEIVPTKDDAKNALASQVRSLAAGGFGGVCAVVVGHPFDLVKVRLQTAESGVYKGAIDVVKKSIARDGLRRGLYAGVSAPLVGVTPMCKAASYTSPSRSQRY
jgi:hypothetical protein